ncbi:hypothetical protein LEMLEM_LOCUS16253 [Lemmus lemmus]
MAEGNVAVSGGMTGLKAVYVMAAEASVYDGESEAERGLAISRTLGRLWTKLVSGLTRWLLCAWNPSSWHLVLSEEEALESLLRCQGKAGKGREAVQCRKDDMKNQRIMGPFGGVGFICTIQAQMSPVDCATLAWQQVTSRLSIQSQYLAALTITVCASQSGTFTASSTDVLLGPGQVDPMA